MGADTVAFLQAVGARMSSVALSEGDLVVADFSAPGTIRYYLPGRKWEGGLPQAYCYLRSDTSRTDAGDTDFGERDRQLTVGLDIGVDGAGDAERTHLRAVALADAVRSAYHDPSWLDGVLDSLDLPEITVAHLPGRAVQRSGAAVLLVDLRFRFPEDDGSYG